MKKIIFAVFAASVSLSNFANAQEAVLRPDGSQEIRISNQSGVPVSITIPKGESLNATYAASLQNWQKTVAVPDNQSLGWVSHEAVLLPDGSQEIHMTDPTGKQRVISAKKGESVQKKYHDFLLKEGIPCGCSSPVAPSNQETKTATLGQSTIVSKPGTKN